MKQVEDWQQSWRLASMVLVVVLMTMAVPVTSQPSDRNSTLMRYYCSQYKTMHEKYFLSNLNATLSDLRRQISISKFSAARTLLNGESVWGLAWCRAYLSIPDCLDCFDYGVAQLKSCGLGNGAHVIYSDCDVRYENNNFYTEANNRAGVVVCGNITSSEPAELRKAAEGLLLDLQIAIPRTPNFYGASTRKVAARNATVYAIAQCNLKVSQSVCLECLQLRSTSLYDCIPNTDGRAMDNGCFMRYSTTPFFGQNQTTDIQSFLWDDDSSKKRSYIIGGVIGGVSFLLLLLAFFLWHRRSKKMGRDQQDRSTVSTQLLQGPGTYSYNDLKVATNNFSDECKLGGGVFGEVYKGTLKDGNAVAIKKTFMASSGGKKHFHDELKIISNVHHRHLVRLLGYCTKGTHLFLVHEYMENGSLDQFYGDRARTLNWKQRFEIIFGTARGLAYLHEQYHVTIIHRDIKTSNILLDSEFQPKIADFGLMRLLPEDKTHLSTEFAGTLNHYLAPEYAIHGQLSEKVDTYSFGIVVLEILSGKRYKDAIDDKSATQSLLDHAWNLYENGTHLNLMDDKIDPSEYADEDATKVIEIALICTQSPVSARPAMSEVVTLLSDKSLDERPPVRPTISDDEVKIQVASIESSASNATASTVQLSGR
ncbi:cysteine-rich receptor-like protein kinase 2 [Cynara cardunculus var. scolymus]|nr:cysteine-rich receptor-like protein kinase 2 [Cynara cardunculus var. scolymus]